MHRECGCNVMCMYCTVEPVHIQQSSMGPVRLTGGCFKCTELVQLGPAVLTTIERWLPHTVTIIDRSHCILRVHVYVVVCVY